MRILTFALALLIGLGARGEQRVGLVLSGGGARGIAHAGFIKALEENDVPIDYVAGTSMGAIVAAFYACGYTPDEMLQLFLSDGFKHWSSGVIDQNNTFYLAKPQPTPQWLQINLNLGDSVKLQPTFMPGSLISPLPMNIEFVRLFAPYGQQCKQDFNKLFVPFRCVTSDVYHKRKIVCSSGSLPDAVRASMSFPLVFKPIEMDGVLVYDGGIYDNFPVDVMRTDFKPDIMIGSSVSLPDGKPIQGDMYSQLEDMIIQNNDYSLPAEEGIKVQLPVARFTTLQWSAAKEIFDIGYRKGLEVVDSIKTRVVARRSLDELTRRREAFRSASPQLSFDAVTVQGASPQQADYLKYIFNPQDDKEISMEEAYEGYYRVISEGKLIDLVPKAEPTFSKTGKLQSNTLSLKATVKDKFSVGVGGWLTTSTQSMLYLDLGYRTLNFNSLDISLAGWIGQTYFAGEARGRVHFRTHIPSYLQLEGVVSRSKDYATELMFYQDNNHIFSTVTEQFVRLSYAMAAGKEGKVWVAGAYGGNADRYATDPNAIKARDKATYRSWVATLGYESNTLNNQLYPSSGHFATLKAEMVNESAKLYLAAQEADPQQMGRHTQVLLSAQWKNYFPLGRAWKLGIDVQGEAMFGPLYMPREAVLAWSKPFAPVPSMKGYFNQAFRSPSWVAAGLMPIWNPMSNLQIRADFYAFASVRGLKSEEGAIRARYDGWFPKLRFAGEVAAVYNFPFASVCVYVNYLSSPARNWNFGINLGHYFRAPRLR